jgi:DNA-binding transcriptional regulator YiaG
MENQDVQTDEGPKRSWGNHNFNQQTKALYQNSRMGRFEMNEPELFCLDGREPAERPYHYRECGLDNVYLTNGFTLEDYDGEKYISIENVDGLWKAIALHLAINQKILSPKEIRFLRTQIDKTQAELGALLRVDDQTVARWEKGKVKLPGPADLALRVCYLTSEKAQPEGGEAMQRWLDLVKELVAKDQLDFSHLRFEKEDGNWTEKDFTPVAA